VLLIIVATACLILAAELHPRWGGMRQIVKAAPPGRRFIYALGAVILLLAANVVMFLIAAFIGLGFGPLYLFVSVIVVLVLAVPALSIPPFNRAIERLSIWQIIWRASAVIMGCLVLAVIYVVIANKAGLLLRFGA
jgi:drug/metabolite transporter (DMT)-like permease